MLKIFANRAPSAAPPPNGHISLVFWPVVKITREAPLTTTRQPVILNSRMNLADLSDRKAVDFRLRPNTPTAAIADERVGLPYVFHYGYEMIPHPFVWELK